MEKEGGGGIGLSERAKSGDRIGAGSSLALRKATNHSVKARGTRVYQAGLNRGSRRDRGLQNMVVSYLVLLEGLEESRGS